MGPGLRRDDTEGLATVTARLHPGRASCEVRFASASSDNGFAVARG